MNRVRIKLVLAGWLLSCCAVGQGEVFTLLAVDGFARAPRPPQPIRSFGPEQIPEVLPGVWKVSVCVRPGYSRGHAWIRYENQHTGEVHTLGRFRKGVRGVRDRKNDRWLVPPVEVTGLHWDYDLRYEQEIARGKYLLDSVVIRDPVVALGSGRFGHGLVRANCVTFARDAWHFYSGRWHDLPLLHVPHTLARDLRRDVENRSAIARPFPAATSPGYITRLPQPTTADVRPAAAW